MNDRPVLGHALLPEFLLDPGFLTVNHGSYGATPRVVLAAQDAWRLRMEAQPTRFMATVLPGALRAAAARLAALVGADSQDVAFVENATSGCNAVLRSLRLSAGDEIVTLAHVYGAVRNTIRYFADRSGARLVEVPVPFPRPDPDEIVANLVACLGARTRIAVLDHITSSSALVLPIARMVAACHAAGVRVLVDGAHAPGQVALDLRVLGADWYVGNCHKWLMAPKGCGFIHARADRQADLHPVTISHGYGGGFIAEFDWTGTHDPSACLAVTAAIDFYERLGGGRLEARNACLAAEASSLVAARLGTETGLGNSPAGSMGMVRLPLREPGGAAHALALRARLLDAGTDLPLHAHGEAVWLRLSAQAYNERGDFERLADIVASVVAQEV